MKCNQYEEHPQVNTKYHLVLWKFDTKKCCANKWWITDLDGFELEAFKTKTEADTFRKSLQGQFY